MRIAIIPARGGSKRIPRKNIKEFFGKPMIAWSIEAANASGLFDHVFVSTDDDEIAKVAKNYGASVPFIRPHYLSDDFIGTGPVIKHALEWVLEHIGPVEFVCTIYATAPFVRLVDLIKGFDILTSSSSTMAFAVTSFSYPIQRAFKINKAGRVNMFYPENYDKRSQDLEAAYHDAGQFYWSTAEAIFQQLPMFSEYSSPVILERYCVQDIDSEDDWTRAEYMFSILLKNNYFNDAI